MYFYSIYCLLTPEIKKIYLHLFLISIGTFKKRYQKNHVTKINNADADTCHAVDILSPFQSIHADKSIRSIKKE